MDQSIPYNRSASSNIVEVNLKLFLTMPWRRMGE